MIQLLPRVIPNCSQACEGDFNGYGHATTRWAKAETRADETFLAAGLRADFLVEPTTETEHSERKALSKVKIEIRIERKSRAKATCWVSQFSRRAGISPGDRVAEGQEEKRARLQRVAQEKADKEAERAARAMQSAVDKATKFKEK